MPQEVRKIHRYTHQGPGLPACLGGLLSQGWGWVSLGTRSEVPRVVMDPAACSWGLLCDHHCAKRPDNQKSAEGTEELLGRNPQGRDQLARPGLVLGG